MAEGLDILIKPRIHVSLISMHKSEYRINGGVGFSIASPKSKISIKKSNNFKISDLRIAPLSAEEGDTLSKIVKNAQDSLRINGNICVEIQGDLMTHYGMGTGTSIRLACLEGLVRLYQQSINRVKLVELSGRGGTSGIGINTYFDGGLIFDLGVRPKSPRFQPSSIARQTSLPLVLNRLELPPLKIGLCIPKNIQPKSQHEEIDFFKKNTPIDQIESYKALYHCLFGLYAAIQDNDMETMGKAIINIQKCDWKRQERGLYGDKLIKLEELLYQLGATCVGMSSLGPMLYFFALEKVYPIISNEMPPNECDIHITSFSNSGRLVVE